MGLHVHASAVARTYAVVHAHWLPWIWGAFKWMWGAFKFGTRGKQARGRPHLANFTDCDPPLGNLKLTPLTGHCQHRVTRHPWQDGCVQWRSNQLSSRPVPLLHRTIILKLATSVGNKRVKGEGELVQNPSHKYSNHELRRKLNAFCQKKKGGGAQGGKALRVSFKP